jgi:GR25 family glycosyltransferase involved in LPS biosynthesis
MSNPFDFFDKIYCVNLPNSADRRKAVSIQFELFGILDRVIFDFAPVPPKEIKWSNDDFRPGILGCSLSHLKIMFNAIESDCSNFLVFEDDIKLNCDLLDNSMSRLGGSLKEIPPDWDILYLGGKPTAKVERLSNNLVSINDRMLGTYAYAFNRKAVIEFVNLIFEMMFGNACDTILGGYAINKNTFCVYPPLFSTIPGISLVRGANRNYTDDTKRSWERFAPRR